MGKQIDISKILFFIVILLFLSLIGCSSGSDDNSNDTPSQEEPLVPTADQDNDGLTNEEESSYGTNPWVADTDGDGYSDYDEIINKGFNATSDPYKFNPNIADIPQIKISIDSPPKLSIDHQSTTTSQTTLETGQSTSTASTVTTGETSTESQAVETTVSKQKWGGSVLGKKLPASVGNSTKKTSTTDETSFSWSKEQAAENRQTYENSMAVSAESGFVYNGGEISIIVRVQNTGHIAFTLSDPTISVTQLQPDTDSLLTPIANLNYDTTTQTFNETLGPGVSSSGWIFKNTEITLSDIQSLLNNSNGLIIGASSYELEDEHGVSFNHKLTDIRAKTATVIIDYGPGEAFSKEYRMVAATLNPSNPGVTMKTVMENNFHIPYENNNGLTSIHNIASEASLNKTWTVIHHYKEGGIDTNTVYNNIEIENYDFDAITLQAGDIILLVYRNDSDNDGLGKREEIMLGTDPENDDTDEDNITDGDEVFASTNPFDGIQISDVSGDSSATSVATDPNGNFYVVGYGTDLVSSGSYKDWWIKKYDKHGHEISNGWNKTFDGNGGPDVAHVVKVDDVGNVYVAGYGNDIATYNISGGISGNTNRDWWIKKFNSNGDELWDLKLDGLAGGNDEATGLAIGDDDYVYVTGYGTGLESGGAIDSRMDWMINRINNSNGEFVGRSPSFYHYHEFSAWPIIYNDTNNYSQTAQSIAFLPGERFAPLLVFDSIIVGGWEYTNNLFGAPSNWRIKKYNLPLDEHQFTEQTIGWNKTINTGSNGSNRLYSILISGTDLYSIGLGDAMAGISAWIPGTPEPQHKGDWLIKKFSSNGTEDTTNWNLVFNSNDYTTVDRDDTDTAYTITSDNTSIWVAGTGNNFLPSATVSSKNTDWWIKRFSKSSGNEMTLSWKTTLDGFEKTDEAKGIAVNSSGTVMIVGYVTDSDDNKKWSIRKVYNNPFAFDD